MSTAQHTPGPRLSSNQRLVLKGMTDKSQGIFHLLRLYDVSRAALLRKGCIVFNNERGMYEVTDAGRKALEAAAEWCEQCGVDVYVDGKCCAHGCGHMKGAAIAKTTGSAA